MQMNQFCNEGAIMCVHTRTHTPQISRDSVGQKPTEKFSTKVSSQ